MIEQSNPQLSLRGRGLRWWTRRTALGGLMLTSAIGAFVWLAGAVAKAELASRRPVPGQLVRVDGRALHINCVGQGPPTVILEAGLNDFSVVWTEVQRETAAVVRVCSYDRAGFGWSDPSPEPRTGTAMVRDLHALLAGADVAPPYVLVGHSFGGALVRLFAHQYPNEAVGLVLVDAAHEDLFVRIPAWRKAVEASLRQFRLLGPLSDWGVMAWSPERIPDRGFPETALEQYRAVLATTGFFDAATAETAALESNLGELRAARIPRPGSLPLTVVSRGRRGAFLTGLSEAENREAWDTWQVLQAELAGLSSDAVALVATESGHDIPLEQPQIVVEAIREIVRRITPRTAIPLPRAPG